MYWNRCRMCRADAVERQRDDTVPHLLNSSSLSEHLLPQSAAQPDVVTHSVHDDQTSVKLCQLEASHARLLRQLAATSSDLRLRTLGFEAMTVLVQHLTNEVVGTCMLSVQCIFTLVIFCCERHTSANRTVHLAVVWRLGISHTWTTHTLGTGYWLVRMQWRPAGWSVCLPLLIFPCTIKSRSSLLAPAHPGGPGKRAVNGCGVVDHPHNGDPVGTERPHSSLSPLFGPYPLWPNGCPSQQLLSSCSKSCICDCLQ